MKIKIIFVVWILGTAVSPAHADEPMSHSHAMPGMTIDETDTHASTGMHGM